MLVWKKKNMIASLCLKSTRELNTFVPLLDLAQHGRSILLGNMKRNDKLSMEDLGEDSQLQISYFCTVYVDLSQEVAGSHLLFNGDWRSHVYSDQVTFRLLTPFPNLKGITY